MAFPFRNILCPVDFEENSLQALNVAADITRQNDGTLFLMHVASIAIAPVTMPTYVDLYKAQEETALRRLQKLAREHLSGLKYQLFTHVGDPATGILRTQKAVGADLIVMGTHGRRGFSRFLLGSIAEYVLRESTCPVLTVRGVATQKFLVGAWMTRNPVTAAPDEKLSTVHDKMLEGGFRCVPVVKDDAMVGILTDRDIRDHTGYLEHTEAFKAMSEALVTVSPSTSIREAARLLRERKIGALPVVEDGKLIGVITTTDVLNAITAEEEPAAQA